MNQILSKEISKYSWITRVKVGYAKSLLCWIEMCPRYTCFNLPSQCGFRGLSSPIHSLSSRHRALQLICPSSIRATEQARGFEPPTISESHPISRLISRKALRLNSRLIGQKTRTGRQRSTHAAARDTITFAFASILPCPEADSVQAP